MITAMFVTVGERSAWFVGVQRDLRREPRAGLRRRENLQHNAVISVAENACRLS